MAIFLIRHGETNSNAARIVQLPETPLSDRGNAQAESLARRLVPAGISRVLCSDYARAEMTAEQVRLATGAELVIEPALRERHFGELRGRPYTEVGEYIFSEDYEPPGGESWEAFHERVDGAWRRVQHESDETAGNLAVVTHGLVCYSLLLRHLLLPAGQEPTQRFGNTSLTIIDDAPPWRVRLVNCSAHLEGGSADDPRSLSGA